MACSDESQSKNQAALDSFLEDIAVAPFEANAARTYGPLRAAHHEDNVTLVTNYETDFLHFDAPRVEN